MAQYAKYSSLGEKHTPKGKPFMAIQNISHKKKLIGENKVVCIKIGAEWCGPCKHIAPDYSKMAQNYCKYGTCMLVDEDYDLKLSDNVAAIPAFHFYKNGSFVHSITGADLKQVEKILGELLQEYK